MNEKLAILVKDVKVWFNGIFISLIPIGELIKSNIDTVKDYLPQIQSYVSDNTFKWVGLVVVVVNLLLHMKRVTKEPKDVNPTGN